MIKFVHVNKVYPNGFQALTDINLEIQDGEFVAIIGLSGAGKSTLLRTINKMIPISSGEAYVDGNDISKLNKKELRMLRRTIGMVFQSFNLVKRSSVINNVLAGRVAYNSTLSTMFGIFPKSDKMLALEALDKVNILEKAFVRADQLSGGQQQRVALARALSQQPHLILADEPVASLDPITTLDVMDDFKRINESMKITIIANMHHVDLALQYAHRIIGLKEGKIVFDGPVSAVNDDILLQIYGRPISEKEKLGVVEKEASV